MWGARRYGKCTVTSDPTAAGKVYVSTSNGNPSYTATSANSTNNKSGTSSVSLDFYISAQSPATNYVFRGWAKGSATNSIVYSTQEKQKVTVTATSTSSSSPTTDNYFAIYSRLTADSTKVRFGSVDVGSSATSKNITITHAHADKITAEISGTNAGDFSVSTDTPVASSVAQGTVTITVTFAPTCNGARSATLTLKSDAKKGSENLLSDVSIPLSGTGSRIANPLAVAATSKNMMVDATWSNVVSTKPSDGTVTVTYSKNGVATYTPSTNKLKAVGEGTTDVIISQAASCMYVAASCTITVKVDRYEQTIEWDEIREDMLLGSTQTVSATASSGLEVTYSSSNGKVTVSGDVLTAAEEGTATITATQAGNYKYKPVYITQDVTVSDKKTPVYEPSFDGSTCGLLVDGTATIEIDNVSDGTTGDFTLIIAEGSVISATRSGSTVTVTGLKQGSTTLTLKQKENSAIFGKSETYTFNVERVTNTLAVAAATKNMKVDDKWTPVISVKNSNATVETSSSKPAVAVYNVAGDSITAFTEGSTDIIIKQAQNVKYTAAACTIRVNVTKYDNTLAVTESFSKKVDDTWNCTLSTVNSNAAVVVTPLNSTDSLGVTYNSGTKTVSFDAKQAGTYKVKLEQAATYKYTAASETITVNVTKYTNTITATLSPTGTSLTWGDTRTVTLSATNTDYTGSPLLVTQTSGVASARYDSVSPTTGTILALPTDGSATWTVTQAATYKYEEATKTITVSSAGVAANACYVLQQDGEQSLNTIEEGSSMAIGSGKRGKLSFDACYPDINNWFATQNFFVQYSTDNGSNWLDLAEPTLTKNYQNFSYDLEEGTTHIRFITKTGATWVKKYKNVRIPRLVYFNASTDWIALSPTVESQKTKTFTLDYSQCDWGNIHVVSTNPKFSVSPSTISVPANKYGTPEITVTCAEDATPADAGYIILYNKAQKCSIEVQVSRPEPVLTWNPYGNPYFVNTTIADICVSENTDYANCPLTYSSNKTSVAEVNSNGELVIYNKKEEVTITVHQDENENFLETTKTFTFTPMDMPDLAVPFVMTNSIYNKALANVGDKSWVSNDNAIQLGKEGGINMNWSTKHIIFMFHGSPDKLTFKFKNSTATTSAQFLVQESSNGTTWTTAESFTGSHTSYTESGEIQLKPNTLYIKFYFSGNYAGYFKDIKITELIGDYYLQDSESEEYLSRGKTWSTRAITDEYGAPVRITRTTPDNSNIYTHYQFYDSRLYLFEDGDSHDIYTDNTSNITWTSLEQSDGTYLIQSANGVGTNGRYLYSNNGILALTTDALSATHWKYKHADQHPAAMTALKDAQAKAVTARTSDFGENVTWSGLNEAMSEFDFTSVTVPSVSETRKSSDRNTTSENDYCNPYYYENTVNGLDTGLYRLTVEACYRPTAGATAKENYDNVHENVLAYIFANDQKSQIKSIYAEGTPAAGTSNVTSLFNAGKFKNYVFVYVTDEGAGTGSIHYGIHKPSWVDNDWLCYRSFTLERISRKEFILDGNGTDEQTATWHTDDNWADNELPGENNWAIIRHDAIVSTHVSVYGVRIENDAVLNIASEGGLSVGAGGIVGANAGNLILKAETTGEHKGRTGFLRINPACKTEMPHASVELFSKAFYDKSKDADNSAAWQYVGSPVTPETAERAEITYYGSWVYGWDETSGDWSNIGNNGKLQPFKGYCTTQKQDADGKLYTYEGQLTSNQTDIVVPLSYHTGHTDANDNGFNLLANSFSAPIDLTQFRASDFSDGAEPVIYLYNTGSASDWQALQQAGSLYDNSIHSSTAAGQYVAVPVGDAGVLAGMIEADADIPSVIPAMQGFRINATSNDATVRLNYNRLVWQGNYTTYKNKALRAPKAETEPSDSTEATIMSGTVVLTLSVGGMTDKVYLFESEQYTAAFDRCSDASKVDGGRFNIYATSGEESRPLAVCATDDLAGVRIGLRTSVYDTYTVSCTYSETDSPLALRDLLTDAVMPLTRDNSYTFTATPDSRTDARFVIEQYTDLDNPYNTGNEGVTTGVDETEGRTASEGQVRIYSPDGRLLRITEMSGTEDDFSGEGLPAGVYVVRKGNKTTKTVVR